MFNSPIPITRAVDSDSIIYNVTALSILPLSIIYPIYYMLSLEDTVFPVSFTFKSKLCYISITVYSNLKMWIIIFFLIISIPRIKALSISIRQLNYYREEIEKLKRENKILEKKIKKLKEDPFYAEKILRENYGFIKEGEQIIRIEGK